MRKICIFNQKGGVGKTTTAINLAAGLSRMNKKVLLIDLDPQGDSTHCLNSKGPRDIYDFLLNECPFHECISNLGENLDMISTTDELLRAEAVLFNKENKEFILKERMKNVVNFDYVLVDCPPSIGLLVKNALNFCDEVFIPISTDALGIRGAQNTMTYIEKFNELYEHKIKVSKVIPTLFDARNKICKNSLSEITNLYYEITTDPIRINSKLKEAQKAQQSIFKYAKSSTGAKDHLSLVHSVIQDELSIKEINSKSNEEIKIVA